MLRILMTVCWLCSFFGTSVCISFTPKIGIVGGGIGGTSCAYFLRELFQKSAVIELFEHDTIGGRLNVLNVDGKYYESGGSVIHPRNKHMVEFLKILGLKTKKPQGGTFGIYDGQKFVFRESDWYFVTMADFLWRYGFSVFELWKEVKAVLDDFSRIYKLQEQEHAFTTVYGLLEYMSPNFKNLTQETLQSHLLKKSYSKLLLEELVQSVMMVNYGQTNNISAFAGFVSLAGADNNLWSVEGGNKLVAEGLLQKSEAAAINGEVTEIELLPDGSYSLKYIESSTGEALELVYDIVIVAAPFIKDHKNIKFTNFKKDFHQYETAYHRTIATFVKGSLNPIAFNSPDVPQEVLTFQPNLLFNSIGRVFPVSDIERREEDEVYKLFSKQSLSKSNVDEFFKNVEIIKEKDWLAYPHYDPPENLAPFFLYPGLYYVNAIELTASAMEMSAIAAKNVALLAFNLWNNMVDKVDHYNRVYKDEL